MKDPDLEKKIRKIASKAATDLEIEFVHLEVAGEKRNMTVRVYIDKPGGVNVEDCADVSRSIEDKLDADDLIPNTYVLEVSSPGLERELFSIDDFRRFAGHKVKVKLNSPVHEQKVFVGTIESVNGSNVVISEKRLGEIEIPYDTVLKANLRVDLEKEFKKR
ncbi:MAG TPA: ribosome maturation factor RimP [Pyrinomonadaceae bacterium]|nr:ribosome maturation factor RimP [Pyrinomonadaceae bacterium]